MRSASDDLLPESPVVENGNPGPRIEFLANRSPGSGFVFAPVHCVLLGLCVVVFLLGNLHWFPNEGRGVWRYAPAAAVSGDEPHYLVMIHSLLSDGDLDVGNQYRRAAAGGLEAGRRFQGVSLDHHTFIVDAAAGQSELWQRIYDLQRPRSCVGPDCVPYEQMKDSPIVSSPDSYERPAHAVGYPLVAAVFAALSRATPEAVEPVVACFSVCVSLLTMIVTFLAARSIGLSGWASLGVVALLAIASPWVVYSKSFFSEPLLGLCMAGAMWGLATRRVVIVAISVALAFVVKPPFAVVGAAAFVCFIQRGRQRDALWVLAIVGSSVVGTVLYNLFTTHQFIVSGSSGWRWAHGLSSLLATFFSGQHGVLVFTPWLAIALGVGVLGKLFGRGLRSDAGWGIDSGLSHPLVLSLLFYLLVVSMQSGTGGSSYGPRYWVPFMPWFALLAVAQAAAARHPWEKFWLFPAALGTAVFVIPAALQYSRVWDRPPHAGLVELWRHFM